MSPSARPRSLQQRHSPYFQFALHDGVTLKWNFLVGLIWGRKECGKKGLGEKSGLGWGWVSFSAHGHTFLQLKGNLGEGQYLIFYLPSIYFCIFTQTDENKVDGVSVPKGQSGNSSRGPGDGGNKDHWKESDRYACSLLPFVICHLMLDTCVPVVKKFLVLQVLPYLLW